MDARRVMVIGLDCAPPALVFDQLRAILPNLSRLIERGRHGRMRSVVPPITVPAWACMTSGRDPGELGMYGFRNRVAGSTKLALSDASSLRQKRIWDVAGGANKSVSVLYVPLTSPVTEVNGSMLGCFLGDGSHSVHPPALGPTLEKRFGAHRPDVDEFRTDDVDGLLDALYATGGQHFQIARALWNEERPDFLMMVEMGTDRVQHAMWKHLDTTHPEHDPSDPRVREARDYYAFIDAQLGSLVREAGDDTAILVVSDHGARTKRGGVAINEVLRRLGRLTLLEETSGVCALSDEMIDWDRTSAWGAGGYYARVFLNVAGREPNGIVAPKDLDRTIDELIDELSAALPDIEIDALRPKEIYRDTAGFPPDLLVFFDDLALRSFGTVGGELIAANDDRGPDGCNHDWDGIFIAAGAGVAPDSQPLKHLSLYDVGPTVLSLLNVDKPDDWLGNDRSES